MADRRGIGNVVGPPRFLAFLLILLIGSPLAAGALHGWALGAMAGFDAAALVFLFSCIPLLGTREAAAIREHAEANDANRGFLLALTGIVMMVLLIAIAAETVGHNPEPFTKGLIIATLALAWLFSNIVYALHYAHLAYIRPKIGCLGFQFPRTPHPVYWDFVYFSFACGMAFATSDVEITETHVRKVVTMHCLAAFAFNIGALAFTINVLASG
ncbi:MAG: DUF1345 domain-containing protein [Sphingomicrobium sp.]